VYYYGFLWFNGFLCVLGVVFVPALRPIMSLHGSCTILPSHALLAHLHSGWIDGFSHRATIDMRSYAHQMIQWHVRNFKANHLCFLQRLHLLPPPSNNNTPLLNNPTPQPNLPNNIPL
jgi:hypothetical protein